MEPIITKHLRGSKCGQTNWFELSPDEELTIGRDPSNKLAFHQDEDDLVGRKHAKIIRHGDSFVIIDLNSRNGTFINNERLTGPRLLRSGDVIEFGAGGPRVQFYQGKESLAGPETKISQPSQLIRPTRFVSLADPPPSEDASHTTVEPMAAPATNSRPRNGMIGVGAVVLLITTFLGVTFFLEKLSQPLAARGGPRPAEASTASELWHALATYRELVLFVIGSLVIIALLSLFIFRRED
ncbi:MAG: FHA domain-containing protein [Acidobacteria bacterium]|nr:FHA domain-containing protein [Acidobacteriota bacterium]